MNRRNSINIWKSAFQNVEGPLLPPCPPRLTEPQYANLAFSEHCHVGAIWFLDDLIFNYSQGVSQGAFVPVPGGLGSPSPLLLELLLHEVRDFMHCTEL